MNIARSVVLNKFAEYQPTDNVVLRVADIYVAGGVSEAEAQIKLMDTAKVCPPVSYTMHDIEVLTIV